MVPAEAITVHKSQGSNLSRLSVILRDTATGQRLPRKSLYVALSRATSLNGLYLIGKFEAPAKPDRNEKVIVEID